MTSTATRRRTTLRCAAATLGLVTAGALAVRVPPPTRDPVRAHQSHQAEPARPAVAYDPDLRPSDTSRSGVRLFLPGAGAPADLTLLADGQGLR